MIECTILAKFALTSFPPVATVLTWRHGTSSRLIRDGCYIICIKATFRRAPCLTFTLAVSLHRTEILRTLGIVGVAVISDLLLLHESGEGRPKVSVRL